MTRIPVPRPQPYFTRWDGTAVKPAYGKQTADDQVAGTYGLKKTYVQETPVAEFAPINYAPYKRFLDRWEVSRTDHLSAPSLALGPGTFTHSQLHELFWEMAGTVHHRSIVR